MLYILLKFHAHIYFSYFLSFYCEMYILVLSPAVTFREIFFKRLRDIIDELLWNIKDRIMARIVFSPLTVKGEGPENDESLKVFAYRGVKPRNGMEVEVLALHLINRAMNKENLVAFYASESVAFVSPNCKPAQLRARRRMLGNNIIREIYKWYFES